MSYGLDFKVTPAEISTAAANCDSTATELAAQLDSLRQYVMGLEAEWQGIAAQTFTSLMADYQIYSTMLHNALTDIASGLRGNYVNYTDSEDTNIANLQQVGGEIPGANFA